jgi:hypothetical protein
MDNNYQDIQTVIRLANRQRSAALGSAISAGWHQCQRHLVSLLLGMQRKPAGAKCFPWLETTA